MSKIILVTGGSGLIGHGLQIALKSSTALILAKDKWIFLSSSDVDLCDFQATKNIFNLHNPTHVIHLAGMVGGLFYNTKQNLEFFRKNMLINDNVLRAVAESGSVVKVISCLSTCIFPDKTTYPIDESMIHLGPPHDSNFGYAYAKRMIDIMNRAYQEKIGDRCLFTSIIPCNIFGPFDNFNLENSHVLPALIHKTYKKQIKIADEITICGTGKPQRQFIYSPDLGRFLIWMINEYNDVEPIIVANEEEISISDVIYTILKTANMQTCPIYFDTSKADGQFRKTASTTKLKQLLPDFKFTSFNVAVHETYKWFTENYNNCRK